MAYGNFLKIYLLIYLERRKRGEKEKERNIGSVASRTPPTGDLACNPGTYPDWESN